MPLQKLRYFASYMFKNLFKATSEKFASMTTTLFLEEIPEVRKHQSLNPEDRSYSMVSHGSAKREVSPSKFIKLPIINSNPVVQALKKLQIRG
jgi:hypothetical protein